MQKSILLTEAIQQYTQHLTLRQYSKQTLRGYSIDLKQLNIFLSNYMNAPIFLDENYQCIVRHPKLDGNQTKSMIWQVIS